MQFAYSICKLQELRHHFAYGSIFENHLITEVHKPIFNHKLRSKLYFYRDSQNTEVDLLIDAGIKKIGVEIKSAQTFVPDFTLGLARLREMLGARFSGTVVYQGQLSQSVGGFSLINAHNLEEILGYVT